MEISGPSDPRGEFVVHTDRPAIRRLHGMILLLHAIVAAAAVAAIILVGRFDVGRPSALPILIVLVGQIFQLSYHSFVYGSRIAINEPLTVNHWGFTMNTAAGRMNVPWEAVTGLSTRQRLWNRILILHLHPAAQPGSPGVQTDIAQRYWDRLQRYGGPMLGEKGVRESVPDIIAAIGHFSGGRVLVRT